MGRPCVGGGVLGEGFNDWGGAWTGHIAFIFSAGVPFLICQGGWLQAREFPLRRTGVPESPLGAQEESP